MGKDLDKVREERGKDFDVGDEVRLLHADGFTFNPEFTKGLAFKDVYGVIIDVHVYYAKVNLFSLKTQEPISLTDETKPWTFYFDALRHI